MKKQRDQAIVSSSLYGICSGLWIANSILTKSTLSTICASLFGIDCGLNLSKVIKYNTELETEKEKDRKLTK